MDRIDRFDVSGFEFKGFEPNSELKQKCREIFSLMEGRAPSESAKQVSITKIPWGYRGNLKITSASCIFEVSVKEREPSHLVNKLYKKFSMEILNWNKNRNLSP